MKLALVVLQDGQVREVRLQQPVQGLELVGVQQAVVDGSGGAWEGKGGGLRGRQRQRAGGKPRQSGPYLRSPT